MMGDQEDWGDVTGMYNTDTVPSWNIERGYDGRVTAKRSDHPEFQILLPPHHVFENNRVLTVQIAHVYQLENYLEWLARNGRLWTIL